MPLSDDTRARFGRTLSAAGLLRAARRSARGVNAIARAEARARRRTARAGFAAFRQQYAEALRPDLRQARRNDRPALLLSTMGRAIELEVTLVKVLELAGFTPVVIVEHGRRHLADYFRLAGVRKVHLWTEFTDPIETWSEAARAVARVRTPDELLDLECAGARAGRFAVSTALRRLRTGSLDLASAPERRATTWFLAAAMAAARASARLLDAVRPAVAVLGDAEYTPMGEFLDLCVARGVDAISHEHAHRSNALMVKRYTRDTRDEYRSSLSDATWALVQAIPWNPTRQAELTDELHRSYAGGDWYSDVGTQFGAGPCDPDELRRRARLDPARPTAVICPHISWDAPVGGGPTLYPTYEAWLIETVRAACANADVNWLVKIHPANVGKAAREGFEPTSVEVAAIERHVGPLPAHVSIVPADTAVSTWSWFGVMDYCVTVRGTVGLEAALRGIPTLTAGVGRYDRHGFTIDAESREQYLERLARITSIPALTSAQRELARRYAYGQFLLRPLPLTSLTLAFHEGRAAAGGLSVEADTRINVRTEEQWRQAQDLRALARWVAAPDQLDFLNETALRIAQSPAA
jgi:hypothetical protein